MVEEKGEGDCVEEECREEGEEAGEEEERGESEAERGEGAAGKDGLPTVEAEESFRGQTEKEDKIQDNPTIDTALFCLSLHTDT